MSFQGPSLGNAVIDTNDGTIQSGGATWQAVDSSTTDQSTLNIGVIPIVSGSASANPVEGGFGIVGKAWAGHNPENPQDNSLGEELAEAETKELFEALKACREADAKFDEILVSLVDNAFLIGVFHDIQTAKKRNFKIMQLINDEIIDRAEENAGNVMTETPVVPDSETDNETRKSLLKIIAELPADDPYKKTWKQENPFTEENVTYRVETQVR